KMSGMPAWGRTHDDASIWGLVAFVQVLPELSPEDYRKMVPLPAHGAGGAPHEHGVHSHEGGRETPAQGQSRAHSHEHAGR
ncbi:MAG TPA: cytochrome c, partial [Burkholderiales bacterium]|nr:cytochrome c [Burkholderiales bacterium]